MKRYQDLRFTDDFMFCKVMTANPDLCRRVLSLLLGKKIRGIVLHGTQQAVDITAGAKGIRMDVYLDDDEGSVYDLEMQATSKKHLPKRLRYYQSMLDLNRLESGADYGELPHTVIIFICTFDFFGERLPVYTFENRCAQLPRLRMGDEAEKIFINPESRRDGLDGGLCGVSGLPAGESRVRRVDEGDRGRGGKGKDAQGMGGRVYEMAGI